MLTALQISGIIQGAVQNYKLLIGLLAVGVLVYWLLDARDDVDDVREDPGEYVEAVGDRAESGLGGLFSATTSFAIVLLSIGTTLWSEVMQFGNQLMSMLGIGPVVLGHVSWGAISLTALNTDIGLSGSDLFWIFVVITVLALVWRYGDDEAENMSAAAPVGLLFGREPVVLQSADPVSQAVMWGLEAIRGPLATPIAVVTGMILLAFMARRFRSGEDPVVEYTAESEAGYMGILLSGVHVVMLLVGIITFVTWPLPMRSPLFGVVLFGAVAGSYLLEKREAQEGAQSPLLGSDS